MDDQQNIKKNSSMVSKILKVLLIGFLLVVLLFIFGRQLLIAGLTSCTRTFPYISSSSNIKLHNKLVYQGGVGSVCVSELDGSKIKKLFDPEYPKKTFVGLDYEREKIYYSEYTLDYTSGIERETYDIFEQNVNGNSSEKILSFIPNYSHFAEDSFLMSEDGKMAIYLDGKDLKIFSFADKTSQLLFDGDCATCASYWPLSWSWSPDNRSLIVSRYTRSSDGQGTESFLLFDPLAGVIKINSLPTYNYGQAKWLPDNKRFIVGNGNKLVIYNIETRQSADLAGQWDPNSSVEVQSVSLDGGKAMVIAARRLNGSEEVRFEKEIFILDIRNNTLESIGKRTEDAVRDWFDGEIMNPISIETIWARNNRHLFIAGLEKNSETIVFDTETRGKKNTNLSVNSFIVFTP